MSKPLTTEELLENNKHLSHADLEKLRLWSEKMERKDAMAKEDEDKGDAE